MKHKIPSMGRKSAAFFILWMTAYLLIFSIFALNHAYAENELLDTHGCAVGEWVQHGHATFEGLASSAVIFSLVTKNESQAVSCFERITFAFDYSRGPPSQS